MMIFFEYTTLASISRKVSIVQYWSLLCLKEWVLAYGRSRQQQRFRSISMENTNVSVFEEEDSCLIALKVAT